MVSPKSKGNKRENDVANHLREKGYLVMVSPRTMRRVGNRYFSMSNDYFNLFDICAKDNDKRLWEKSTRWIQVKSHMSDYYKTRKDLEKFWENSCEDNEKVEVWVRTRKDNKIVWRVFIYSSGWYEHDKLNSKFERI